MGRYEEGWNDRDRRGRSREASPRDRDDRNWRERALDRYRDRPADDRRDAYGYGTRHRDRDYEPGYERGYERADTRYEDRAYARDRNDRRGPTAERAYGRRNDGYTRMGDEGLREEPRRPSYPVGEREGYRRPVSSSHGDDYRRGDDRGYDFDRGYGFDRGYDRDDGRGYGSQRRRGDERRDAPYGRRDRPEGPARDGRPGRHGFAGRPAEAEDFSMDQRHAERRWHAGEERGPGYAPGSYERRSYLHGGRDRSDRGESTHEQNDRRGRVYHLRNSNVW